MFNNRTESDLYANFMLQQFMHPQVDGELMLAPGFPAPPNTDYIGYHTYIGMYTVFVQNKYYKCARHYHKIQFLWCSYILKFLLILDGCKTNNHTMKFSQNFLGRTCNNQDHGYAAQTTWTVCWPTTCLCPNCMCSIHVQTRNSGLKIFLQTAGWC